MIPLAEPGAGAHDSKVRISACSWGSALCAAALFTAVACGGGTFSFDPFQSDAAVPSDGAAPRPDTAGLPCDVQQLLAEHCQSCHQATPRFGAPMPLMTHADLVAESRSEPGTKVYEHALRLLSASDSERMPPPPNAAVGETQRQQLAAWIAAGAPRSEAQCDAGAPTPPPETLDCEPDISLRPTRTFTMPSNKTDEYVCYGVEVQAAQKRHVYAMAPKVDNARIVHHVLLFESDTPYSTDPTPCSGGGSVAWRLVYGWAPGGSSILLPEEAGFPLEGNKHYVVQLHYNNVQALEGEQDATGFDLCSTANLRANDADVVAFGTQRFTIPAGANHTSDCTMQVPAQFAGVKVIAAMPHMHEIGSRIVTQVEHADGTMQPMGAVQDWNFNTQYWEPLNVGLVAGDTVRTTCSWDNTQGSQNVRFGENTSDEMCYSFTMYYPRIPEMIWALPATVAQCQHRSE